MKSSESGMIVLFLCISWLKLGCFQTVKANCEYEHDARQYFCKNIIDVFPNNFYGNYHLQCVSCTIPTFSNETFPFTNSLVSFNVSESGVKYITNRALSSLSNVQYIYMQNNEIVEIQPGAFSGLRQVYELHLENNQLANIQPGFLSDLEANSVDLSRNRIKEIPNGAFERSLGILMLDLSHNEIKKLHKDSFFGLENIEVFNLEKNSICHLPLGLFKHLSTLRQLDLSDNKLSKFPIGAFSGLKNLHSLNLANNSISVFDGKFLLPFYHLSKLDITGNGIYYLDANAIHLNVPTIRTLRIDDNLFSCTVLINVIQYFKKINVEVASTVHRYDVQNVNGIACTDELITYSLPFDKFFKIAQEDAQRQVSYC